MHDSLPMKGLVLFSDLKYNDNDNNLRIIPNYVFFKCQAVYYNKRKFFRITELTKIPKEMLIVE